MKIEAIIFDLDNTIFSVATIGDKLFAPVFEAIENDGNYQGDLKDIKTEIMRTPFQEVSKKFQFSEELTSRCTEIMSGLTYEEKITPFEDYNLVRKMKCLKFLVTTGFKRLQQSKIDRLEIQSDFTEVFIIDPSESDLTKKDIFRQIRDQYILSPKDVLVIGDDLKSEIQAGKELGLQTVLYNHNHQENDPDGEKVIVNYLELETYC